MAKGLKIGDRVKVLKTFRVKVDDPAHQQGLKRVRAGQVGQVVGTAADCSVVADFKGKRVTVSSQRLALATQALTDLTLKAEPTPTLTGTAQPAALIDYSSAAFLKVAANKLLSAGSAADYPRRSKVLRSACPST